MRGNLSAGQKHQEEKDLEDGVGLHSLSHRAMQQWERKQDTTLEGSEEAAGEVMVSEGHPHVTSPGWSMLGRRLRGWPAGTQSILQEPGGLNQSTALLPHDPPSKQK